MPTLDLSELLNATTDDEDALIRRVAYTAGVLWQCRNADCELDMPRAEPRCTNCGRDRSGQPVRDRVPLTYGPIPDELLTTLRTALADWFTEHGRPQPDAVTFAYTDQYESHDWSDWGTLHFGGRTEPCSFDNSDVAEALTELTEWEAPHWCDEITIALPR